VVAFQTVCFVYSAMLQMAIKPPRDMVYFQKQTRRYYLLARGTFIFQGACIVGWCYAMMRVLHLAK